LPISGEVTASTQAAGSRISSSPAVNPACATKPQLLVVSSLRLLCGSGEEAVVVVVVERRWWWRGGGGGEGMVVVVRGDGVLESGNGGGEQGRWRRWRGGG